ncbi:hypothetical protein AX17_003838 [Amanita inopinata Kibby_2008]|nr:hypothetical protein AX17_003838 [Amanita inopinata Kibby_2008]
MQPVFPLEILTAIVTYLAKDKPTLRNVALASHNLCILTQTHPFSAIHPHGHDDLKFTRPRQILSPQSPRSQVLLQQLGQEKERSSPRLYPPTCHLSTGPSPAAQPPLPFSHLHYPSIATAQLAPPPFP